MKIRTCQLLSDGLNCASLPLGVESEGNYNIGTWRSLVARFAGGEEVAGSNPVVPTNLKNGITSGGSVFLSRDDRMRTKFERTTKCRASRQLFNQKCGGAFLQARTERAERTQSCGPDWRNLMR